MIACLYVSGAINEAGLPAVLRFKAHCRERTPSIRLSGPAPINLEKPDNIRLVLFKIFFTLALFKLFNFDILFAAEPKPDMVFACSISLPRVPAPLNNLLPARPK